MHEFFIVEKQMSCQMLAFRILYLIFVENFQIVPDSKSLQVRPNCAFPVLNCILIKLEEITFSEIAVPILIVHFIDFINFGLTHGGYFPNASLMILLALCFGHIPSQTKFLKNQFEDVFTFFSQGAISLR